MCWYFGQKAHGILAPQPGIEPTVPALEDEVLNTGPPGKSLKMLLKDVESLAEQRRRNRHSAKRVRV